MPAPRQGALVASATNIPGDKKSFHKTAQSWQDASWNYHDSIGEFEFVANWTGNLLSRAVLGVYRNGERVDSTDPVYDVLKQLYGGMANQSAMLRQFGIHFTVAGECYLVSYDDGGVEVWDVVAPQNISKDAGSWKINNKTINDPNPMIIRLWNRHPRYPDQATAPARAALGIMAEIAGLSDHVMAQIRSRLASAGLLMIPNGMAAASSPSSQGGEQGNTVSADGFVKMMYDTMSRGILNRDSAEALVPMVLTAEGEDIEKVQHLTFWSGLDENALALRSEAIRRLALSLDIPPEVLTGSGDMNHWSAWNVDEAAIKSHTEPLLLRVCHDLTVGYLRPAISDLEGVDVSEYSIGADTSEMRLRPNRSKEALELHDRGALSQAALLRETGFKDTDQADDSDRKLQLLWKMATGSATPEMVSAAAKEFGVDLVPEGTNMREARPDPSLKDHPTQDAPDTQEASATRVALRAASEVMVFRAFERAGNKMKNQMKFAARGVDPSESYLFRKCSAEEIEFLLDGSFSQTSRFAGRYGVNAEAWASTLEGYCWSRIEEQKPHDPDVLAVHLETLEVSRV